MIDEPHLYRRRIVRSLAVFAISITLLAAVLIVSIQRRAQDEQVTRTFETVRRVLLASLQASTHTLSATLEVMEGNERFKELFRARDREGLIAEAMPLFADLRDRHGITHLYFVDPDREVFLRLHDIPRRGDTIERLTMLEAASKTVPSHGVELGPLGTLTLRSVRPWFHSDRLIGYLELGQEVERLVLDAHRVTGAELYVLIDKTVLDRSEWESGMRVLGREGDWERFDAFVQVGGATSDSALPLQELAAAESALPRVGDTLEIRSSDRVFRLTIVSLEIAGGQSVARLIAALDVTGLEAESRDVTTVVIAASFVLTAILLIAFNLYLRRMEGELTQTRAARDRYHDLSRRDPLTTLLNRNEFMAILRPELERSRRFDLPASILMLDIDHFKRVNDSYGHQTGDRVLQTLARGISSAIRPFDQLARYGGEEFILLAPQTDPAQGLRLAERIRVAVEQMNFDPPQGEPFHLGISIGMAVFPRDGETPEGLIAAADEALYAAKAQGRGRVVSFESLDAGTKQNSSNA